MYYWELVFVASDDRTVKLWDVLSGELAHTVDLPIGQPMFLGFTQDAEHLVVSATEKMLYIVKTVGGILLINLKQSLGGYV